MCFLGGLNKFVFLYFILTVDIFQKKSLKFKDKVVKHRAVFSKDAFFPLLHVHLLYCVLCDLCLIVYSK